MNQTRAALWMSAIMALAASVATGCGDTGDSSAIPDEDANRPDSGTGSVLDGSANHPKDAAAVDATGDVVSTADTGVEDAGTRDSTVADTGTPDSTVADTGTPDTGTEDTGTPDSGIEDTGTTADTGTVADTGVEDTGAVDTGSPDTGSPDSGAPDSGAADTGVADTGAAGDASDGGGAVVPCTTVGQTGCVPCAGNTTGLCTPTEAVFVQHDIDQGNATVAGGENAVACYFCLEQGGCLDDNEFGDTGDECGDLSGTFDGGAAPTLCLDTLACVLQTSCAALNGGQVSNCYCGPTNAGSACAAAGGAVNGACLTPEVNGLGFAASDNTDILKNFDDNTRPSGMANEIFQCAISNACTTCLQ